MQELSVLITIPADLVILDADMIRYQEKMEKQIESDKCSINGRTRRSSQAPPPIEIHSHPHNGFLNQSLS
jgi:hypothetical protein